MMELYQSFADYNDMMNLTESIFTAAAASVGKSGKITYQGTEIDLTAPWERLTMIEAVKKYTGLDFNKLTDKTAAAAAKKAGVTIDPKKSSWGHCLYETFDQLVECKLIQPVFITDYPVEVSPLAKKIPSDPRLTYRFEFYI